MPSHLLARVALPVLALVLTAAPAFAQDTPQSVAPPPVVPTATPSPSTSTTAVNPEAAAQAANEEAERRPAPRAARTPRAAVRTAAPARVPVPVVAPAPTPTSAVTAPANEAVPAPTASPTPAPAAEASPAAETSAPARDGSTPAREGAVWPWLLAVLAVIAVAVALLARRRRSAREAAWEEQAYGADPAYAPEPEPPAAHVAPIAAAAAAPAMLDRNPPTPVDAPVATPEDATVTDADAADVAALIAATPAGDRPWLELAMRPVRAGTTEADALVQIELTVGNAGSVAAEDVHIATVLLADPTDDEIERILARPPVRGAVEPVRIAAGEGTRIDATLTVPRDRLAQEGRFRPVIVTEARYRLPGGGEGRTAAAFEVGPLGDPDAPLPPITTAGTELRDDIEARLHSTAERV